MEVTIFHSISIAFYDNSCGKGSGFKRQSVTKSFLSLTEKIDPQDLERAIQGMVI